MYVGTTLAKAKKYTQNTQWAQNSNYPVGKHIFPNLLIILKNWGSGISNSLC